jgi:hypothetical protein
LWKPSWKQENFLGNRKTFWKQGTSEIKRPPGKISFEQEIFQATGNLSVNRKLPA